MNTVAELSLIDLARKVEMIRGLDHQLRLQILILLESGKKSFSELKHHVGGSDGAVYYHLLYMGTHDLISTERKAVTEYKLTSRGRTALKLLQEL